MSIFATELIKADGCLSPIDSYDISSLLNESDDVIMTFFYNDPLSTISLASTHLQSKFVGVKEAVIFRENNRLNRALNKIRVRISELLTECDDFDYNRFINIVVQTRSAIDTICSDERWKDSVNVDSLISAAMIAIALKHLPDDVIHYSLMGHEIDAFLSDELYQLTQSSRKVVSIDRTEPLFDELAAMRAINRYVIDKISIAPFY